MFNALEVIVLTACFAPWIALIIWMIYCWFKYK